MDFKDELHANYYWSENLVQNAIDEGWYTPAKKDDWSDFDFAMAYQEGGDKKFDWRRADTAWPILLGHAPEQLRQFSEKPSRYIGLEECREVLSLTRVGIRRGVKLRCQPPTITVGRNVKCK